MKKQTEGYVVLAQNNHDTDYVRCARVLAKSLKMTGDSRPITLITDRLDYPSIDIFDSVEILPKTDSVSNVDWRLEDDWAVYDLSPYERTFKIESDVIITRSIDHWWEICRDRDLVIATGTRNYLQRKSDVRYYRHGLDKNHLPDVYNGITYFRKSRLSKNFFSLVKKIFKNWNKINNNLESPSSLESADTDTVYAIASSILGVENTTLATDIIQWIHMKSRINGTVEDWTQELIWELVNDDFRINTISQLWPVHYHIKSLAGRLEPIYDEQLSKKR